jgi:hypothetical protein
LDKNTSGRDGETVNSHLAKEWEEGIADTGIGQLYKIRGRNGDTG